MPEPENKPTFVLIHGAWAGSWVWDALKPELEAAGHRVLAFDMPGNPQHPAAAEDISMAGCMAHIAAACAEIEGPLLLVGHSGGGVIVTQAAEMLAERVAGVAYLAGMMLPSGLGFAELTTELRTIRKPSASGPIYTGRRIANPRQCRRRRCAKSSCRICRATRPWPQRNASVANPKAPERWSPTGLRSALAVCHGCM